ncbi:hypothetical protein [Nitrosococcus oceani]|uniref:Uncharacterized protein n=2 Tax=Nitrosococcus oceani TaxID=1229 RepID=Q3J9Y5_NITOC|nr:hypothetical protein [Nitrosococcus oceani]ABA58361.1 hypothetical protein Noc_1895 [Nitrosococcus oceani ATCC 19707]
MKRLGRIIVILMGTLALVLHISISSASEHGNINGLHQSEANKTYNEPLSLIHPGSPRGVTGKTFQYTELDTPLGGRYFISDILTESTAWQLWDGSSAELFDITEQSPENYDNAHNHYQSLLVELVSVLPGANAVPIWGDSTAAVSGASAWGSFFSARSNCDNQVIKTALPQAEKECSEDFDAQLTGLEIDVLNAGKPGVYPNMAKHGVQIVGFGNPNSHALSIIAHGFNRPEGEQDGQFEAVIYAQNALVPKYGRFMVSDQSQAMMGIDYRKTLFTQGAGLFRSDGVGTGLIFNEGTGGEIYAGSRWPGLETDNWLTLRAGRGGLRIVSNDNTEELLVVDRDGKVSIKGIPLHKTIIQALEPSSATGWVPTLIILILFVGACGVAVGFFIARSLIRKELSALARK